MVLDYRPGHTPTPVPTPSAPDPLLLYTVPAAAKQLGISERSLYRLMDAGEVGWVPGLIRGRAIEHTELERIIAERRAERDRARATLAQPRRKGGRS